MPDQKALPAAATLEEKVKERVKGFMLDALGDEEIEKLVKQSMKDFVDGYTKTTYDPYNRAVQTQVPGQLREMVQSAVFEEMRKRVGESLKNSLKPIIGAKFGSDDVDSATQELIKSLGPALLEGVIKGFAGQMIPAVANAIVSAIQYQQNQVTIPARTF